MIPIHSPFHGVNEEKYVLDVLRNGETSGGGKYTRSVEKHLSELYHRSTFLVNSCTAALEITAHVMNIQAGDEVILPTYTFPSTANAFLLRGATLRFVDCSAEHPNMDLDHLESLITPKTKAVVALYYGGVALDMERLLTLKNKHQFFLVEEAAQSFGAYYFNGEERNLLGTFGDFAVISFHATKNISAGEGGALIIKDEYYRQQVERLIEKGTNRSGFLRGEVPFYEWTGIGSSYVNSELNAAYLLSQLEDADLYFQIRCERWKKLYEALSEIPDRNFELPYLYSFAEHNAHLFYLTFHNKDSAEIFMSGMKNFGFQAVRHYRCLHSSTYFAPNYTGKHLENAHRFEEVLVRIPFNIENQGGIVESVLKSSRK